VLKKVKGLCVFCLKRTLLKSWRSKIGLSERWFSLGVERQQLDPSIQATYQAENENCLLVGKAWQMEYVFVKTKIHSICYCEPEAHPPMVEVRTIKYERKYNLSDRYFAHR